MNFEFNETQRLVRDSFRRFCEAELTEADRRHGDHELTRDVAGALLAKLKPFGVLGRDRTNDPIIDSVHFHELGRVFPSLAGVAFIAREIATLIASSAHPELAGRLAEPMMNGELIGCAAISEPGVGSDPSGVACRAEPAGEGWVLNGTKQWISNGSIADIAVVTAQTDQAAGRSGLRQFVVDRRESHFESRDIPTIGLRAFPCAELIFSDVRVPAINQLGGCGPRAAGRVSHDFHPARVMCADAACGIAERAIERALDYVKERRQFGREIGRFQLVQGMLADMVMDYEAARLLTFKARLAIGASSADTSVSIAKAYATEMGVRVVSKAMECMGAIGLAKEIGLERRLRDARMWIVPDGTSQIQRLIIGRELTGFSSTRH